MVIWKGPLGVTREACVAKERDDSVELSPKLGLKQTQLWISRNDAAAELIGREFVGLNQTGSFRVSGDVLDDLSQGNLFFFLVLKHVIIGLILQFIPQSPERVICRFAKVLHGQQLIARF